MNKGPKKSIYLWDPMGPLDGLPYGGQRGLRKHVKKLIITFLNLISIGLPIPNITIL